MKITIERTAEQYMAPINGVLVPTQIWRGVTTGGVPCDVYVLSIVPDAGYLVQWANERPAGMRPTRKVMTVNVDDDEATRRAKYIHQFGTEPPENS